MAEQWMRVTVRDLTDCPRCLEHYFAEPHLAGACASVGIERGLSSGEMLRRYLADYHRGGHKGRELGER